MVANHSTRTLYAAPHEGPVEVDLGLDSNDQPVAVIGIYLDKGNRQTLGFDDPAVLRSLAAHALTAAVYLEEK